LKQDIKNVEILYQKALYKECAKFVKRAKKTAADYEKFYYLFELIAWEKKLMEEDYEEGLFNHNLDDLIKEETRVIEQLRNLAEYHILYSKINYVFRSGGFTRNETERKVVEEISEYHLIKGKNTAISVRATSICYYIQGLCAASNRDYDTALINFRKTKAILEKNSKIKSDLPNRYIYTLNFLMLCYIDASDFVNAEKMYTELCELQDKKGYKSLDSEVKIFSTAAVGKMQILNKQGKFAKALEVIPEIDAKVEKYADKLNKEKLLLIDYSKAYSYFGVGDFKESLKLINGVLNDNEKQLRQDVYSFSRIFNLVIHFELGNFDFIEYESKSTSRFLNKHEKDYQIEKVFMKYIKKIAKEDFGPDKKIIFENFYAEVEELMKDPSEQVILEYFDVKSWLYSKIKRKDFAEVLQSV